MRRSDTLNQRLELEDWYWKRASCFSSTALFFESTPRIRGLILFWLSSIFLLLITSNQRLELEDWYLVKWLTLPVLFTSNQRLELEDWYQTKSHCPAAQTHFESTPRIRGLILSFPWMPLFTCETSNQRLELEDWYPDDRVVPWTPQSSNQRLE